MTLFHKQKQVKPGFTNYQPQPKYSRALSKKSKGGKIITKAKNFYVLEILKTVENSIYSTRASTKGRKLAFVPVRRFLKPFFIRVHFVLNRHDHAFLQFSGTF